MIYPLIDIGVNLTNKAFKRHHGELLERARAQGIVAMIVTGTDEATSEAAIDLCRELGPDFGDALYCTCGVHPHDAKTVSPAILQSIRQMAASPFVKAIGETGLDFNRDFSPRPLQERAFESQLELAVEQGLPIFMHERDAHSRFFDIVKDYRDQLCDGVVHCFTADRQALFNYLDLDLHIGITGWICDERRGQELQQIVHNIPLSRLMLETDAPYLLPRTITPKPKSRQNEPAFLPYVLATLAEHYPSDVEEIAAAATATSRAFFRIPA